MLQEKTIAGRRFASAGNVWLVVALIAINLLAYAPVWGYGFVNYDDPQYITDNPGVTAGLTWRAVLWAFTTGHEANWHPVTWLSHMLDVQLYGLNAGAHHLTNLLLHIANTLLLFWLFSQTTGAPAPSALVAALFAVHPLHVESVVWLAERKDVLSTLFWMLTLSAYILYLRQPQLKRYLVVLTLFALGLMAKPMLVTLPFVLLLLDFWPLGRLTFKAQTNLSKLIREKFPFFILTVISSAVTIIVQQKGGAVVGVDSIPVTNRVANACIAYFAYVRRMFWPTGLAVLYPTSPAVPGWLAAALGLIGLSILAIWTAKRWPYIPVGWFWYLGTLVPVIGLVQVGRQAMADRYTYVPLIGLFLIVAFGLNDLLASLQARKLAFAFASAGAIACCLWVTRAQLHYWSSSRELWEHTINVTADNSLAHFNLGAALESEGKGEEAIYHYSEALRIEPQYADAHYSLANALMKSGKPEKLGEADTHLAEALRINPNFPEVHNALGIRSLVEGKSDEAIRELSEAVRLKPDYALAHNNLGSALGNVGRLDEAISEYTEAVHLDPGYGEAHTNLGILLAKQGKADDAMHHFSEALRINSDNQMARAWLADLKSKKAATR